MNFKCQAQKLERNRIKNKRPRTGFSTLQWVNRLLNYATKEVLIVLSLVYFCCSPGKQLRPKFPNTFIVVVITWVIWAHHRKQQINQPKNR